MFVIFSSHLIQIQTLDQEKSFTELLQTILDHTSDTLPLLAEGFRESKRYIKVISFLRHFSTFLFFSARIIDEEFP